jgi:hypothetical protein
MVTCEPDKFVLMLSSGQRPRYRDDIIRLMALPMGGRLQFRYRQKHVADEIFRQLGENRLRGAQAIAAYLDTSREGDPPEIVPCRFARIVDSEVEGEFAVARFEVCALARVGDVTDIRQEVKNKLLDGSVLPEWKNGNLEGHFLLALAGKPADCRPDPDPSAWQAIVANLGEHQDFRGCPFFYYLRAIVQEGDSARLRLHDGGYVLKPDAVYRLEVIHYTPSTNSPGPQEVLGSIRVGLEGPGIQRLTTNRLAVDSPYDIKHVSFRTIGETTTQYALLSCARPAVAAGGDEQAEQLDFQFVLKVKGAWKRQLIVGLLIAVSLATPRLVDLFAPAPGLAAAVYVLSGLVTAGLVIFGLRKVP